MCIIVIKKAGIAMPDTETLKNCWDNNSNGAGFMYADRGTVHIRKGFMKYRHFIKALKNTKIDKVNTPMIFHFRITTHGGTMPGNTHPFPLTGDIKELKKLKNRCSIGIAHNGTIPVKPRQKDISDTMEYIISQLYPLHQLRKNFYLLKAGKELVSNAIDSKMVFLDNKGNIETIGEFNEDNGILYSNYSYYKYSYFDWSRWDSYLTNYQSTKKLMWLTTGYVKLLDGTMCEPWDYLIDDKGNVYRYEYIEDTVRRIYRAVAFTDDGGFPRYEEELSEELQVLW